MLPYRDHPITPFWRGNEPLVWGRARLTFRNGNTSWMVNRKSWVILKVVSPWPAASSSWVCHVPMPSAPIKIMECRETPTETMSAPPNFLPRTCFLPISAQWILLQLLKLKPGCVYKSHTDASRHLTGCMPAAAKLRAWRWLFGTILGGYWQKTLSSTPSLHPTAACVAAILSEVCSDILYIYFIGKIHSEL